MTQTGWRTVAITDRKKLCLRDENLVIKDDDEEIQLPVCQLSQVIIMSPEGSVTVPLLNELVQKHVSVLVCNEKREPVIELMPVIPTGDVAGCLLDQSRWREGRKMSAWASIVRNKIDMQIGLL